MKQRLLIFFILGIVILIADLVFNNEDDNKITIFESEVNSLITLGSLKWEESLQCQK